MNPKSLLVAGVALVTSLATTLWSSPAANAQTWAPKKAALMTRWAAQVDPKNPLPEYPRPQLVRTQWQSLNGLWGYKPGKVGDAAPVGTKLVKQILVPFPVESALSGVMEHHERLWYRRNFSVPAKWKGQRLRLNFGAVDYEAQVFVNGKSVGTHTGGYEAFSYDITPFLKASGPQELIVRVFDPTENAGQPRGKQTTKPEGIMYTPTTGIWQTVWMEPVAPTAIESLHMVPDIDSKLVRFTVNASNAGANARAFIKIKDGQKVVQSIAVLPGVETAIPVKNAKLWSPNSPFLYSVAVTLVDGAATDSVSSYFGMRKISVGPVNGVQRMLLNNKFVFQMGPLDQGFWPDGLYTAPTDEALRYDIEVTKQLGFNMTRKHIKVEPARWYYHADKLGIMVWQDMPSANSYTNRPQPLDKEAYIRQLNNTIRTHWNSPSIIMWVIFNEGQGRHDTKKLVDMAKTLDPSRLTNRDSGGGYEADDREGTIGDVDDVHSYPPPATPGRATTKQALACGEYGGIGLVVKGRTWKSSGWGYTTINNAKELEELYGEFTGMLKDFRDKNGLSAAVYTEITDVEIETNGLLTYDRVLKCDPKQIALANRFAYPLPTFQTVVPTSQETSQTWKYSFAEPVSTWTTMNFDDSTWQSGAVGFGTANTPGIGKLGTTWNTPDIWMRRTFNPGTLTATQMSQLGLRLYHDEDVDVYINGVLAYQKTGYVSSYKFQPISAAAKAAIVPNGDNVLAVHCHQTGGGQYIDVGLSQRIPPKK